MISAAPALLLLADSFVFVPPLDREFVTTCSRYGLIRSDPNSRAGYPSRRVEVSQSPDGTVRAALAPLGRRPDRPTEIKDAVVLAAETGLFGGEGTVRHVAYAVERDSVSNLVRGVERIGQGRLIAIDVGEWGGALIWLADDGQVHHVYGQSGKTLARDGAGVFATLGSTHGFGGTGWLLRLSPTEGPPRIVESYLTPTVLLDLAIHEGMVVGASGAGPVVLHDGVMTHPAWRPPLAPGDGRYYDEYDHGAAVSVAVTEDGVAYLGGNGGYSVYPDLPRSFAFDYFRLADPCEGLPGEPKPPGKGEKRP